MNKPLTQYLLDTTKPLGATILVACGVAIIHDSYPKFASNNTFVWQSWLLMAIGGNSLLMGLKWAVQEIFPATQVHLHRVEVGINHPTE